MGNGASVGCGKTHKEGYEPGLPEVKTITPRSSTEARLISPRDDLFLPPIAKEGAPERDVEMEQMAKATKEIDESVEDRARFIRMDAWLAKHEFFVARPDKNSGDPDKVAEDKKKAKDLMKETFVFHVNEVMKIKTAKQRLIDMSNKIPELKAEIRHLKNEKDKLTEANNKIPELQEELRKLKEKNKSLTHDAEYVASLQEENRYLKEQIENEAALHALGRRSGMDARLAVGDQDKENGQNLPGSPGFATKSGSFSLDSGKYIPRRLPKIRLATAVELNEDT